MNLRLRDFYRALARLLRAGVVLSEALNDLRSSGTLPDALGDDIRRRVDGGDPLSKALAAHPESVPHEDVALIEAGEATGRLEETLDSLAGLREEREDARRRLVTEAWYPIFLFHTAALLVPLAGLSVKGEFSVIGWLLRSSLLIGGAWALVFALARLYRSAVWRERFREIVDRLPGFGAAARHRRRAVFATALEAAYQSGMPVDRAVHLAAKAAQLPEGEDAARAVSAGEPLTTGLTRTDILPTSALSQLATGEQAGEISAVLKSIANDEAGQAREGFRRSMITLGKLIYLVVAAWIAIFVITFYVNLYSSAF